MIFIPTQACSHRHRRLDADGVRYFCKLRPKTPSKGRGEGDSSHA